MTKTIPQHIADILELVQAMHREELRVYGQSDIDLRMYELQYLLRCLTQNPESKAFSNP